MPQELKKSWVLVTEGFIGMIRNYNRLGNNNLHSLHYGASINVAHPKADLCVTWKITELCRSLGAQPTPHPSLLRAFVSSNVDRYCPLHESICSPGHISSLDCNHIAPCVPKKLCSLTYLSVIRPRRQASSSPVSSVGVSVHIAPAVEILGVPSNCAAG